MDWAGGWCWLDRYELEGLASEVLSFRTPTVGRTPRCRRHRDSSATRTSQIRTKTRYGGAVDVKRAADLYGQGWTLRQIAAELGVHWSTVRQQLQSAGVSVRSNGPRAHPTSTQEILELRDQGLSWNEVAKQVD